jgi:predicted nucleic acid-binding Zn ribbon protein
MPVWNEDELKRLSQEVAGRRRKPAAPQRIADVLSRLMARRGYAYVESSLEWETIWCDVAGSHMAAHSRVGRLHRGVLEIIVRNSATLQELTFRRQELLAELKKVVPSQTVNELRFRVGELD